MFLAVKMTLRVFRCLILGLRKYTDNIFQVRTTAKLEVWRNLKRVKSFVENVGALVSTRKTNSMTATVRTFYAEIFRVHVMNDFGILDNNVALCEIHRKRFPQQFSKRLVGNFCNIEMKIALISGTKRTYL